MKRTLSVAALVMTFQTLGYSAVQTHPVDIRQLVLTNHGSHERVSHSGYGFRMEIIGDADGMKTERLQNGRSWIAAQPNESYSIRLYNPLPVRVAVNVSVDGLNTLTGQPSGIKDGAKWMIEAYSFIELRGWQVNGSESRRFFFTEKPKSYVQWRGDQTGKALAANAGVIGAAYFWSQEELDAYYAAQPIDERTPQPYSFRNESPVSTYNGAQLQGRGSLSDVSAAAMAGSVDAAPMTAKKEKAATGMGERESNPTTEIAFNYDRGMYHAREAIAIYYDFAPVPTPNPFPDLVGAPEMPMVR